MIEQNKNDVDSANEQLEQQRIQEIMESAASKHVVKRLVHEITGHPKHDVYYGNASEGATCKCGYHWGPADMRV